MRRRAALAALLLGAPPAARAACPDTATVARFALDLLERRVPAPFPGLTAEDAGCARDRLVALLAQPWGDVEGHAVAADADPPLRGALFHATLRAASGAVIEAGYAAHPAVAPGLLLRLGADAVPGRPPAIAAAMPYLALLDLAALPDGSAAARQAGNLGLRLGLRGAERPGGEGLGAPLTLQANGSVMASLPGFDAAALLGWLVRDLARDGRILRAGEYAALLAAPAPLPPRRGESWRLSIPGLGVAGVSFG